jgi:hypothetical protein
MKTPMSNAKQITNSVSAIGVLRRDDNKGLRGRKRRITWRKAGLTLHVVGRVLKKQ